MTDAPHADEPDSDSSGDEDITKGNSSSKQCRPRILNPEIKLEDCREKYGANCPSGRGSGTAAGRGYNAELLAQAVLEKDVMFYRYSDGSWYDNFISTEERHGYVESKCCVEQYPSGPSGRFRIWSHNHGVIFYADEDWYTEKADFLYFFVVYTVEDGIEKEVGKLLATVKQIDAVLDCATWTKRNHQSMGEQRARDISWRVLLDRLDVSEERFREADAIDLTTRDCP
jgi:hypothetical protein